MHNFHEETKQSTNCCDYEYRILYEFVCMYLTGLLRDFADASKVGTDDRIAFVNWNREGRGHSAIGSGARCTTTR